MSAEIKDEHWPTHFEYEYYISETYIYKMNTNITKI